MNPINEKQAVPSVAFRARKDNDWLDLNSEDIFANKTVVVFSLPGAFTPTCSSSHVPRYNTLTPILKQHGVDEVVCISVNDGFTMSAWQNDQRAENITFLPDGNGEFTEGMGMLVDKSDLGFGKRSWRYSMLVKDGIIDKLFIEPDLPGDPFEVSDADTMLGYIAPNAAIPPAISVITKPGCPYCMRAKQLLTEQGLQYEDIVLGNQGITMVTLNALSGQSTVPQIFFDGVHIGDSEALAAHLATQTAA